MTSPIQMCSNYMNVVTKIMFWFNVKTMINLKIISDTTFERPSSPKNILGTLKDVFKTRMLATL